MKYRKKPVVIDAIQFKGADSMDAVDAFMSEGEGFPRAPDGHREGTGFQAYPDRVVIMTLEGTMFAEVGDWIIRGVKGELYPCKPDIFDLTYEPA